eukprot:g6042.t1
MPRKKAGVKKRRSRSPRKGSSLRPKASTRKKEGAQKQILSGEKGDTTTSDKQTLDSSNTSFSASSDAVQHINSNGNGTGSVKEKNEMNHNGSVVDTKTDKQGHVAEGDCDFVSGEKFFSGGSSKIDEPDNSATVLKGKNPWKLPPLRETRAGSELELLLNSDLNDFRKELGEPLSTAAEEKKGDTAGPTPTTVEGARNAVKNTENKNRKNVEYVHQNGDSNTEKKNGVSKVKGDERVKPTPKPVVASSLFGSNGSVKPKFIPKPISSGISSKKKSATSLFGGTESSAKLPTSRSTPTPALRAATNLFSTMQPTTERAANNLFESVPGASNGRTAFFDSNAAASPGNDNTK